MAKTDSRRRASPARPGGERRAADQHRDDEAVEAEPHQRAPAAPVGAARPDAAPSPPRPRPTGRRRPPPRCRRRRARGRSRAAATASPYCPPRRPASPRRAGRSARAKGRSRSSRRMPGSGAAISSAELRGRTRSRLHLAKRAPICQRVTFPQQSGIGMSASWEEARAETPLRARGGRRPALAFPERLHQASGDGRLDHPLVEGADRQDAGAGRLGELQVVRRIWPGRRHLHRACAAAHGARRDPDRDRHQCGFHPLSEPQVHRQPARCRSPARPPTSARSSPIAASSMPITSSPACPSRPCRRASARRSPRRPPTALRPGGAFLVYQFSPKVRDFMAPHFERIDKRLRMGQHPALPPVLGLEGLSRSAAAPACARRPKFRRLRS